MEGQKNAQGMKFWEKLSLLKTEHLPFWVIFNSRFCLSQVSHQQVCIGTVPTAVLNSMEYIAKEMMVKFNF